LDYKHNKTNCQIGVKQLTNEEQLLIAIKADTTNLMSGLKTASSGISNFNKKIAGIGKGMTIAGAAITAGFVMAIKTASGFEQSMANTASVAGATTEELERMTKAARDMGEQSVYSASQAADAQYYLASAGMKVNEIIGALEGTMALAAATQSDLAFTSEAVAATLSQYNLEAEEASRVANVFAAAISGSQATMEKLKTSMSYVGPVAKSLGMTLEDTTGILMNLYNAGYDGSKAGTALRMAFAKLLAPTKDTAETMDKLKVSITDSSGEMRPFKDIIDDLATKGMTAADSMKIFGTRAGPTMMALISQGEGAIQKMTDAVTNTTKATDMAATQIDTFQGQMKLLKSAFEEFQITLVQDLMPALRPFIEQVTEAITKTSDWIKENPELTATLVKITAAVGALMAVVGPLLLLLPSIVSGLNLVKGAVTPLNTQIVLITANIVIWWKVIAELDKILHSHHTTIQDVNDAYEIHNRALIGLKKAYNMTDEELQYWIDNQKLAPSVIERTTQVIEEQNNTLDDQIQKIIEEQKAYDVLQEFLEPVKDTIKELTKELTPYEQKLADVNAKYDDMVEAIKMFNVTEEEQAAAIEKVNIARDAEIAKLGEEKAALKKVIEAQEKLTNTTKTITDRIYELTHTAMENNIRKLDEQKQEYINLGVAIEEVNQWYDAEIVKLNEVNQAKEETLNKNIEVAESIKPIIEKTKEATEATKQLADIGASAFDGFTTQIKRATTAMSSFTKEAIAAAITQIKMKFFPVLQDLYASLETAGHAFGSLIQGQIDKVNRMMNEQIATVMYGMETYEEELAKLGGATNDLASITSGATNSMTSSWNNVTNAANETAEAINEAAEAMSAPGIWGMGVGSGGGSGGGGGSFFGSSSGNTPSSGGGSISPISTPRNSTYSPTINISIQGDGNATEIKRAVQEALDEAARQYNRRGFELVPGMG